jgi:hypothetical protein
MSQMGQNLKFACTSASASCGHAAVLALVRVVPKADERGRSKAAIRSPRRRSAGGG